MSYNPQTAEALLRKSRKLSAIQYETVLVPPAFEAQQWQNAVDNALEPLFETQKELDDELSHLKEKLLIAPPDKRASIERRIKRINRQIDKLDDSYEAMRQFVASMCTSFYVEFSKLDIELNSAIEDWQRSHDFMAQLALQQTEKLCKEKVL